MLSSNPNTSQVGGSHYQSKFQHWDLVNTVLHGRYLEGCVTKYMRWRKKNGVEDLKKAIHYIEKIISLYAGPEKIEDSWLRGIYLLWKPKYPAMLDLHIKETPLITLSAIHAYATTWAKHNDVGEIEGHIVFLMASWRGTPDLQEAIDLIHQLIQEAESK